MSENGGGTADQPATPRSRLMEYAEMSAGQPTAGADEETAQGGLRPSGIQAPPAEVLPDADGLDGSDGSDGSDGMVFPPVKGIVPDAVTVDDRDEPEGHAA